jgi:uncharacterized protein YdeI (YjbR/CyaY-like superfamily)
MADEPAVPPALEQALDADPDARDAFERLAPSHRREYAQWIEEAKQDETRARRVEKTLGMLRER